ncbi:MAG: GNAT family N-acetyltransferase [Lachnospiraceae bacterium]|nr:GNAT family N-acetyltransferase [Lachnospiraceae bacterium]
MNELTIIPYTEKFRDLLKKRDPAIASEIENNGDIIASTVILAVRGLSSKKPVISGAGYLIRGLGSYESSAYEGKRFLHASFTGFGKDEVFASDMLLDRLISIYREKYTDHTLRLWCRARNAVYLDFLIAKGFCVENTMLVMECDLTDHPELRERPDFSATEFTTDLPMDEYLLSNGEAFGIPDSRNDMLYRLKYLDARVFAVCTNGSITAAVTTWPLSEDRFSSLHATENIFCMPSKRRQGITSSLLYHVLYTLRSRGVTRVSLNVYGNNRAAIDLYLRSGYEVTDTLLELHLHEGGI